MAEQVSGIGPPGARDYLRLQFPSHPRYVALIRDVVYRLCIQHNFTPRGAFDLKIITGEALTNIIKHAYKGATDRPISLEALIYPSYAEVRFRDVGIQRPITANMAQDLSDYREGGIGVYMIGKLSDYHYYDQNSKTGTLLVVKKRIT